MEKLLALFMYLAFGLLVHLMVTDAFSWQDPWTYITMVFWPVVAAFYIMLLFIFAIIVFLVIAAIVHVLENY